MFGRKPRETEDAEALAALIADARRWESGGRHARRTEQLGPVRRERTGSRRPIWSDR
ncbi:hypothetical protein [Kitasatospora sp. NPDC057015]|uniref:hypothetical protein n=1 Tax=Kitasatospora sp. NPDC057015 TaxID=3346001 RepID=UPI00363109BF